MENRLRYEEICSAYLLLGQSHILHSEWLGKWRLAQAQCLMHTTCRTQEGISWFFGKKLARIQQWSIKVLHVLEKFTDILSPLRTNFQPASWLAWRGSNLALLAAGFSLESCFLPYLLRKTDQQPRHKSIWAKSHLLKSGNHFTSRHSWTNAFPDRNGCKRVADSPNGHCYKTKKTFRSVGWITHQTKICMAWIILFWVDSNKE